METVQLFKQYMEYLFAGKRSGARELILGAHDRGFAAEKLLSRIVWPAMEQINKLYRENHISRITEHMATRINRMIADQLTPVMNRRQKDGRRMVVLCGAEEEAELGAQIASDIFEAGGWTVWFVGSGVPNDELIPFLGQVTPDILLVYSSIPRELPGVRKLITLVREIGICRDMQVMVCGGVYNRAEDLAEEIKADLFAHDVREAISLAEENPSRASLADVPEPGRRRKRKRRTSPPGIEHLRRTLGIESPQAEQAADEAADEAAQTEQKPTRRAS